MNRYVGVKQAVKDGYIACKIGGVADFLYPSSKLRRGRVQGDGDISPTLTTTSGVCKVMDKEMLEERVEQVEDYLVNGFGIFKLSPKECGRLMNVEDADIDKILKVNSKTQAYKQFGNSIVVSVLMAIFSQLNIKGVTPWNEMSEDDRYRMIYKGCEVGNADNRGTDS